jgi:hypothetical protein
LSSVTPSPGSSASATPRPSGSGSSPAASPAANPDEPELFAVDLFDLEESNIAPGDGSRLVAVGSTADGAQSGGIARDEFWPLIALLILVLLVGEWLVWERDGVRRLVGRARGLLRRPGRRGASA